MNDFIEFYKIKAEQFFCQCQIARLEHGENSVQFFKYAMGEFETYRKAAGLPENWQPEQE